MDEAVKDAMRNTIIESASGVFKYYGYRKTTMDDIAQSLGKGKSSIYYYFKSKEDIFKEVVEYEAEILRNDLLTVVEKHTEPLEMMRSYVLARMHVFKKVNGFYKALNSEMQLQLSFIDETRAKYEKLEIELVMQILKEGIAKNLYVIEDPKLGAIAIVTALRGLENPMFNTDNLQFEQQLDQLLNILFMGIIKR